MKPRFCQSVEKHIWRYIDRELSAREVSEISIHLRDCHSCKALYESRAREASLYRMAFVEAPFGDVFAERFRESFIHEMDEFPSSDSSSEIFTFNPPMRHRRVAVAVSVAAMVLVVVAGGFFKGWDLTHRSASDPPSSPSATANGLGRFIGGTESGVREEPGDDFVVKPGAVYTSSSPDPERDVVMRLLDGSQLTLSQRRSWKFAIDEESKQNGLFSARLLEGDVEARVSKRTPEKPFRIVTPNARVEVIGTQFVVSFQDDGGLKTTNIQVLEGKVFWVDRVTGEDGFLTPDDPEKRIVSGAELPKKGPGEQIRPDGVDSVLEFPVESPREKRTAEPRQKTPPLDLPPTSAGGGSSKEE